MNKIKLFGSEKPRAAAGKARWLVLACLLMPMTMSGQEMIREIFDATSDVTFARSMSSYKQWVVYNDNNKMSLFGRMDTSGYGNVFVKTDQHINVNDIELVGQTLYFCGSMYNNDEDVRGDVGVMGYFSLWDFNNPSTMTINYIFFNEFSELKKLTYYTRNSTSHVCMVGTGKDNVDYIVDAYRTPAGVSPTSGNWKRAWINLPNIDAVFDDIISYGDDIAVSAKVENMTEVQICFITKTPLVDIPFFATSTVDMAKVPDAPMGEVLLQTTKEDLYAFYRYGPYLDVCKFIGRSNYLSFHIPILHTGGIFYETFRLKDVCVDNNYDEMSVLVEKSVKTRLSNHIYHIPESLFPLGGSVYAHVYLQTNGYAPMSLCGGKDYHTVSMGQYLNNWGMARVVNPIYGGCAAFLEANTETKHPGEDPISKGFKITYGPTKLLEMPVSVLEYEVLQMCGDFYIKDNNNQ